MTEHLGDQRPDSDELRAGQIRDMIDQRIGEHMVGFADHIEGLGFEISTITATDLIAQLRQQGQVLRMTGGPDAVEPG